MLFSSFQFAFFFPLVAAVTFLLPSRFRGLWLLAASYYFYMAWKPIYALLLVAATLLNYGAALAMARRPGLLWRRIWLVAGLSGSLGMLFFFKYYGFFQDSADYCLGLLGGSSGLPEWRFLLPVGISFYTFQALSYLVEVYWGKQAPERNLGRFALYTAFFPQLVAGPIERAQRLLPQFRQFADFDYGRVRSGVQLMAWGLFKKVVIADRLALLVDTVYDSPEAYAGPTLVIATIFFGYQIYCDFSGYSDIAIGAAQVLGVDLMQNFRRPHGATSIVDFWRRWHISLSTWFRDYVYIPLGGNRAALGRWTFNILLVFFLSGLWHGARWNFVFWGLAHGVCLILERLAAPYAPRLHRLAGLEGRPRLLHGFQVFRTFSLVTLAWVLFRVETLAEAGTVYAGMFQNWSILGNWEFFSGAWGVPGIFPRGFWFSIGLLVFLEGVHALQSRGSIRARIAQQPLWLRWSLYSAGLWAIVLFGILKQKEFIYFVF
jgi:alginate O-acetyltransferase complex protein AlgI